MPRQSACIRALILDELEEYDEYITEMSRRIEADQSDFAAWNNRGVAHWEIGQREEAMRDFGMACTICYTDTAPFLNRASLLVEANNAEAALIDASKANTIDPEHVSVYSVRAQIHRRLGNISAAESDERRGKELQFVT